MLPKIINMFAVCPLCANPAQGKSFWRTDLMVCCCLFNYIVCNPAVVSRWTQVVILQLTSRPSESKLKPVGFFVIFLWLCPAAPAGNGLSPSHSTCVPRDCRVTNLTWGHIFGAKGLSQSRDICDTHPWAEGSLLLSCAPTCTKPLACPYTCERTVKGHFVISVEG